MLILGIRQNEMIRLELPDGTQVKIRFIGSRIVFDLPDAVKVSRERFAVNAQGKPLEGVS